MPPLPKPDPCRGLDILGTGLKDGPDPLRSVTFCDSPTAVQRLLQLVRANGPILDATWGNGTFWTDCASWGGREIWGMDVDPLRARSICGSFLQLPVRDAAVPTVVYDPPFHPYVNSAEEVRFKGMGQNERELKALFQAGLRECWRVTSRHLLVKCQGFVHNHAPQWMPLWAVEICGEPFEWLMAARTHKRVSGRWTSTRSLHRNHADYLVFDKRGNKR